MNVTHIYYKLYMLRILPVGTTVQLVTAPYPIKCLITGNHALDCPVLPCAEHLKGLFILFKLEAMSDERFHVHQLLGQQVDGNWIAVSRSKSKLGITTFSKEGILKN